MDVDIVTVGVVISAILVTNLAAFLSDKSILSISIMYRAAILMGSLPLGIDTSRFVEDVEYRRETILGLAM